MTSTENLNNILTVEDYLKSLGYYPIKYGGVANGRYSDEQGNVVRVSSKPDFVGYPEIVYDVPPVITGPKNP